MTESELARRVEHLQQLLLKANACVQHADEVTDQAKATVTRALAARDAAETEAARLQILLSWHHEADGPCPHCARAQI